MNEWINQWMYEWKNDQHSALGRWWQIKPKVLGGGTLFSLVYHKSEMQQSGTKTRPPSDRLVPNHVMHDTEFWTLMSSLNFYCVPPPPSTAAMLHSKNSKHCNTVLVQSQHTAHSVSVVTESNTLQNSNTVLTTTRHNFLSSLYHLLLLTYQRPMMEKESMCKKMC